MGDKKDTWQYNATITIRLEKTLKDRLWLEAEARGISPSEYIRGFLENAMLPDKLIEVLSDSHKTRIKKHIQKERSYGKSSSDVVLQVFRFAVTHYLDNVNCGF